MEIDIRVLLQEVLLDTQERVRDFMRYSDQVEDEKLKHFFKAYAEDEGKQAHQLQEYIEEMQQNEKKLG